MVRERMAEEFPAQFQITRYEDTNAQVYKIVPLDLDTADPSKWRTDLNISAPASTGIGVTLEVLPTVEGKGVGTALFKPGNEATRLGFCAMTVVWSAETVAARTSRS